MKWFNDSKISIVLFVFAVAVIFCAGIAYADFTFGAPVSLGPVINSTYGDAVDCISPDGLEMYLDSDRPGGQGQLDIWVAKRATTDANWGAPENLGSVINTAGMDECASISSDGLTLYFDSTRSGGFDIWMTTRATKNDPWGTPVNLGSNINSPYDDAGPCISADGLELYFFSNRTGGYGRYDIYVAKRATINEPWGTATDLGSVVNSENEELFQSLSTDGLLLFFSDWYNSPRTGGFGSCDSWMTRRTTTSDQWQTPVNLGPMVNGLYLDSYPRISPDGFTLYFSSERPGGLGGFGGDIYQAPILPIVDFNGDEIVDINDLVIFIDNWETESNLCDIGPMPWGDGVVDKSDLEVLMSYWGQEFKFLPIDLIAYWRLDETEGTIAQDSAGDKDGTLQNGPVWQPEGGITKGALQLDGINDYVSTPFILSPYFGSFSVFAWVKSSAAGRVILSQKSGANWLLTDTGGKLITELKASGTSGQTLLSQAIITDGNWHRIGLVRDGTSRILYVDDVEVAKDTQTSLLSNINGLYIGAGKGLESGKFFSGTIDDVRIYDKAVTP